MDNRKQEYLTPGKSNSVNLSDLRDDLTIYLEKTPIKPAMENQMFQVSEITARSTTIPKSNSFSSNIVAETYNTQGIDDILATSCVQEEVQKFYRDSLASLPRTEDISRRSSVNSNQRFSDNNQAAKAVEKENFWDISLASPMEFEDSKLRSNKNFNESNFFTPAEQMQDKLQKDEMEWDRAEATIPGAVNKSSLMESMWENQKFSNVSMSRFFGLNSDTIGEIYPNNSPRKKTQDRVPLVDMTNSLEESLLDPQKFQDSIRCENIAKMIKKGHSPSSFINRVADFDFKEKPERDVEMRIDNTVINSTASNRSSMENTKNSFAADPLRRIENSFNFRIPEKSMQKKMCVMEDTPKTALEPMKRARSPSNDRRDFFAAKLRPPVPAPRKITPEKPCSPSNSIKTPIAVNMSQKPGTSKSFDISSMGTNSLQNRTHENMSSFQTISQSNRTYNTALGVTPKLSLPSYGLHSDNNQVPASPTLSTKSQSQMQSQNANVPGMLKKTTSELSSRSSKSEFEDDLVPLKTSIKQISWETTKLRKSSQKSFNIRNISIRRQTFTISVEGVGFQLYSELRGGTVVLAPSEVRTIYIEFCPRRIGAAKGTILVETAHGFTMKIPLYAFGGHASLNIHGVQKGPYGPHFLTMGNLQQLTESKCLEQIITISNTGNLPAFATLMIDNSKRGDFLSVEEDTVYVSPNQILVESGHDVIVKVRFEPTKEQVKHLIQRRLEVVTVGQICILFADEATRLRVLRYSNVVDPKFLQFLPKSLPKESAIKSQIVQFDEALNTGKIAILMNQMKNVYFDLTINQSLDETQLMSDWTITEDGETISFESFYEVSESSVPSVDVSPRNIFFSQYHDDLKNPKLLTIKSLSKTSAIFVNLSSNCPDLVTLHPTTASLSPCDVLDVRVYGNFYPKKSLENLYIYVTLENSKISVPLTFIPDR